MMFFGIFLAGLVIGALGAWFFAQHRFNQHELQVELNASKEQLQQYRTEVSSHFETTQQLMTQLQENYEKIARHMANTRMTLVERPSVSTDESALNYLSSDTAAQLRQSVGQLKERRRSSIAHQVQPLDYAGQSSGLMKSLVTDKTETS